jgi:hypothetical protein
VRRIPAALSTIAIVASILLSGQATVVGSGNTKPHPTQKPKPTATPRSSPLPTANPTASPTASPTTSPTATPTPSSTASPSACTLFPSDNVWNKPITSLPVRSDSAALINAIGLSTGLHPDFSNVGGYGIPYNLVGSTTARYSVSFYYADESDVGPYPIPNNPLIEGGSDRHLVAWDTSACYLYEIFDASVSGSTWSGGSGAIWDLRSNALRPDGWTSADAAGLPILPGLARYEEVAAGVIAHALRFTTPYTARSYIYPARHQAGCTTNSRCLPPMGLRVRLKATVNISGYSAANQVILTALKTYGLMLADNGSAWYITGVPDMRWNDSDLHLLNGISGTDFEAVDTSGFVSGP